MQEEGHCDEEIYTAMPSVCLSYNNMCHMDGLKIAREDLPLPKPFNKAWELVGKVIDRLHLGNHVDKKYKTLYNPDEKIPKNFNTWVSRFKKVICVMPQIHQFFVLHRLVKYKNKYTGKCHCHRKTPILPKLGNAAIR